MLAVATHDLCRVYERRDGRPPVTALKGVTFDIHVGEVHGLPGRTAREKTTVVKVLSTVLLPSSGLTAILGHDVVAETGAARRLTGVVFGSDRAAHRSLPFERYSRRELRIDSVALPVDRNPYLARF